MSRILVLTSHLFLTAPFSPCYRAHCHLTPHQPHSQETARLLHFPSFCIGQYSVRHSTLPLALAPSLSCFGPGSCVPPGSYRTTEQLTPSNGESSWNQRTFRPSYLPTVAVFLYTMTLDGLLTVPNSMLSCAH